MLSKSLYRLVNLLKNSSSKQINEFYHGSPYKFSILNPSSYVTSNLQHARIFAVQWGSVDVLNDPPEEGKFVFKNAASVPDPHPIYIYKIETEDVEPTLTNMGESYPDVFKTKKAEKVTLIKSYDNWQDVIPYSIANE